MNFKSYLKNKGLASNTIESYNHHVLEFIAFLDVDNTEVENCTSKEILLYLGKLKKKGLSNDTRQMRVFSLKHFFDFEIEHDRRIDNPAKRIKIKGTKKQRIYPTLAPQELQGLYQNYEVPKDNDKRSHFNWFKTYKLSRERNKVVLSLLVNQGITTPEISRIKLDDMNLREGKIDIRGGRMGKDRTLALKSTQIMDLMEYQFKTRTELLKYYKYETNQLFLATPSAGKKEVSQKTTLNIWKSLGAELRKQNSNYINLQQVRASVIVSWIKQYNLREVQYMAGHRQISTTETYLVNDIDNLQAEINKYHPIN